MDRCSSPTDGGCGGTCGRETTLGTCQVNTNPQGGTTDKPTGRNHRPPGSGVPAANIPTTRVKPTTECAGGVLPRWRRAIRDKGFCAQKYNRQRPPPVAKADAGWCMEVYVNVDVRKTGGGIVSSDAWGKCGSGSTKVGAGSFKDNRYVVWGAPRTTRLLWVSQYF